MAISSVAVNLVFLVAVGAQFNPLKPSAKTWWAKQITNDLYTAGRLTETQVKQAHEMGFKSIVVNFNFSTASSIGSEILPTTDQMIELCASVGISYGGMVVPNGESWLHYENVVRLTTLLESSPKPVLYHCGIAYSATFLALNYLANISLHDPKDDLAFNSQALYERAASIGYYFNRPQEKAVVSEVTKEPVVENPVKPELNILAWHQKYWPVKPIFKNWYSAGQMKDNYLDTIGEMFHATVNTRKGLTSKQTNTPSQEEVTLLNINDNTGTYTGKGRQSTERLLETRIDQNRPNSYISPVSAINYESRDALEFGDDVGYNEDHEKQAMTDKGITYYHTPIGGEYGYTVEMFNAYRDTWVEAGKQDAVIVHCRSGYRATVAALLAAGHQYSKSSKWALQRARDLGYHFEEAGHKQVVQLLRQVLDDGVAGGVGRVTGPTMGLVLLLGWITYYSVLLAD